MKIISRLLFVAVIVIGPIRVSAGGSAKTGRVMPEFKPFSSVNNGGQLANDFESWQKDRLEEVRSFVADAPVSIDGNDLQAARALKAAVFSATNRVDELKEEISRLRNDYPDLPVSAFDRFDRTLDDHINVLFSMRRAVGIDAKQARAAMERILAEQFQDRSADAPSMADQAEDSEVSITTEEDAIRYLKAAERGHMVLLPAAYYNPQSAFLSAAIEDARERGVEVRWASRHSYLKGSSAADLAALHVSEWKPVDGIRLLPHARINADHFSAGDFLPADFADFDGPNGTWRRNLLGTSLDRGMWADWHGLIPDRIAGWLGIKRRRDFDPFDSRMFLTALIQRQDHRWEALPPLYGESLSSHLSRLRELPPDLAGAFAPWKLPNRPSQLRFTAAWMTLTLASVSSFVLGAVAAWQFLVPLFNALGQFGATAVVEALGVGMVVSAIFGLVFVVGWPDASATRSSGDRILDNLRDLRRAAPLVLGTLALAGALLASASILLFPIVYLVIGHNGLLSTMTLAAAAAATALTTAGAYILTRPSITSPRIGLDKVTEFFRANSQALRDGNTRFLIPVVAGLLALLVMVAAGLIFHS